MKPIRTARLELVPAMRAHIEADLESPQALGRLLGAAVPVSWPPGEYDRSAMEFFRARLAEDPNAAGWYGWYAILHDDDPPVVIGMVGYLGPPSADGAVEVGYSIAREFMGRAFATEIVNALVARAWSLPVITRVIAHTHPGNAASMKVLERCGFVRAGSTDDTGAIEFELRPPARDEDAAR